MDEFSTEHGGLLKGHLKTHWLQRTDDEQSETQCRGTIEREALANKTSSTSVARSGEASARFRRENRGLFVGNFVVCLACIKVLMRALSLNFRKSPQLSAVVGVLVLQLTGLSCGAKSTEPSRGGSRCPCNDDLKCIDGMCARPYDASVECQGLAEKVTCVGSSDASIYDMECESSSECAKLGSEFACWDRVCRALPRVDTPSGDGFGVPQITAGASHTCVVLTTGNVRCWGYNSDGQLGYGHLENIGDDEPPASAGDVDAGGPIAQVAAGANHTCARLTNGSVRCWGYNLDGQLGYDITNYAVGLDEPPASAGDVNVGGPVVQIAAGGSYTCVLLTTGNVRCWGWGMYGQLGYSSMSHTLDPASAGDVPFL